jgi:hypothetical protein
MTTKIRITTDGVLAKVVVDGKDITKGIASYTLVHKAGEVPELHLVMPAIDVEVGGEAEVVQSVGDEFRRASEEAQPCGNRAEQQ